MHLVINERKPVEEKNQCFSTVNGARCYYDLSPTTSFTIPERGENNISIRSGFIRLRIHARGIREKCAIPFHNPPSTSRKILLTAIVVKKDGGRKKKKQLFLNSQRKEARNIIANLMFNLFPQVCSQVCFSIFLANAREKASFLGHPWRNRGEKFPTSNASTTLFPSLLRRGETWKNINGEERSRAFFARLTSRYARRPQSKECQNICITSSDDRLFCFAQHLFEFTTRYVYAFSVAYPRFYFVACRLVELIEFITPSYDVTEDIYSLSIDRSLELTRRSLERFRDLSLTKTFVYRIVCYLYRSCPISFQFYHENDKLDEKL